MNENLEQQLHERIHDLEVTLGNIYMLARITKDPLPKIIRSVEWALAVERRVLLDADSVARTESHDSTRRFRRDQVIDVHGVIHETGPLREQPPEHGLQTRAAIAAEIGPMMERLARDPESCNGHTGSGDDCPGCDVCRGDLLVIPEERLKPFDPREFVLDRWGEAAAREFDETVTTYTQRRYADTPEGARLREDGLVACNQLGCNENANPEHGKYNMCDTHMREFVESAKNAGSNATR